MMNLMLLPEEKVTPILLAQPVGISFVLVEAALYIRISDKIRSRRVFRKFCLWYA